MKRVTASEARRNWFRLLDAVAAGEVVMIERNGRHIVLRREDRITTAPRVPDYGDLVRMDDPDRAAEWGWEWAPDSGGLEAADTDQ